ncbi:hypothetical protein YB2330_006571 [Saitoella coloradoensis]
MVAYLTALIATGAILQQAPFPKYGLRFTSDFEGFKNQSFGYPNKSNFLLSKYNYTNVWTGIFDQNRLTVPTKSSLLQATNGWNATCVEDPVSGAVWPMSVNGANGTMNETWMNVHIVMDTLPSPDNPNLTILSVSINTSEIQFTKQVTVADTTQIIMYRKNITVLDTLYNSTGNFNLLFLVAGKHDGNTNSIDIPPYMSRFPKNGFPKNGTMGWAYVMNCTSTMTEVVGDCQLIGKNLRNCALNADKTFAP